MKNRSAEKIRFTSYDELLGGIIKEDDENGKLVSISINRLHTFKEHPFRVVDDEEMEELVESIKIYGVLTPGIVRKRDNGYEIVSGHRRKRACEMAGLSDMPVIIRDLSDDEAKILVVDSNIQRKNLLPSEKAKAYRMKMDALKHQGAKGDSHTADVVGEIARESGRTVFRYIRLTYLIPELLEYVDERRISQTSAERLSYLREDEQKLVWEQILLNGSAPGPTQADELKKESEAGNLDKRHIATVLMRKPEQFHVLLSSKRIKEYFPEGYSRQQIETIIFDLLERWRKEQN